MRNTLDELQILLCLHVQAKPSRAPRIVEVHWKRSPSVPWRWKPSWLQCIERISKMNFCVSHIFREGKTVTGSKNCGSTLVIPSCKLVE
ncbi:hypothetical protein PanWU01x14_128670, partial [Parasponia andersonii]